MTIKEKEILDYVKEYITSCLYKNVSKNYLVYWLEDVIDELPKDISSELFLILYKIHDALKLASNRRCDEMNVIEFLNNEFTNIETVLNLQK